jgi:hypothetical protein
LCGTRPRCYYKSQHRLVPHLTSRDTRHFPTLSTPTKVFVRKEQHSSALAGNSQSGHIRPSHSRLTHKPQHITNSPQRLGFDCASFPPGIAAHHGRLQSGAASQARGARARIGGKLCSDCFTRIKRLVAQTWAELESQLPFADFLLYLGGRHYRERVRHGKFIFAGLDMSICEYTDALQLGFRNGEPCFYPSTRTNLWSIETLAPVFKSTLPTIHTLITTALNTSAATMDLARRVLCPPDTDPTQALVHHRAHMIHLP